ncbi:MULTISPECIES: ComF family protein [unclassified Arcicella]|uniref:ComF family protein n=1 Tax=unclassified Arcicella TaxID=2644986 RepID=UPI00285C5A29|nr:MULTISPECIES: ComF family protein [unclassified Arcicella]MDR6564441.1 ComF family protein [Arcicella sp. BE51]MDR6814300.1 ComF family protein [Arcicella sp. BE140]MDR6825678.1 ComF family protein [Arcicella sp. BE139]
MFNAFIDLIFPRICSACLEPLQLNEAVICTHCRFDIPKTNLHLENHNVLMQKFLGKVELKHVMSYLKFIKGGKVQRLMHELKYKGNQEVGEMLGRWYGAELRENGFEEAFDLIIPVPLHKKRLISRGYNQSDCFAKGLSESLNIEWRDDILVRATNTTSQVTKSRLERYQNMDNVFAVKHQEYLKGKKVVVVDDTLTTGATLESCVLSLQEFDIKDISILTLAMA